MGPFFPRKRLEIGYPMKDLSLKEIAIFSPLIIAVLWMGLFSSSLLDVSAVTVQRQPYAYHASP